MCTSRAGAPRALPCWEQEGDNRAEDSGAFPGRQERGPAGSVREPRGPVGGKQPAACRAELGACSSSVGSCCAVFTPPAPTRWATSTGSACPVTWWRTVPTSARPSATAQISSCSSVKVSGRTASSSVPLTRWAGAPAGRGGYGRSTSQVRGAPAQ